MHVRHAVVAVCIFFCVLHSGAASAGPYRFDSKTELKWLLLSGSATLGGLVIDHQKDAPTVADLNNLDRRDLWGIDRRYAGRWNPSAHSRSNLVLATALLSPGALWIGQRRELGGLAVMYLQTHASTLGLVTVVKGLAARYRPYTYGTRAPLDKRLDEDANRSFFSGHSAHITASMVFGAKTFSDYYPNSRFKPWVWAGGLGLAAYGSWQRVEAGRHFPTDVLTGMAWGALTGYLIPHMHLNNKRVGLSHRLTRSDKLTWLPYGGDGLGIALVYRFD